jgi:hypothetical protein
MGQTMAHTPGWRAAFVISLALHALVLGGFCMAPSHARHKAQTTTPPRMFVCALDPSSDASGAYFTWTAHSESKKTTPKSKGASGHSPQPSSAPIAASPTVPPKSWGPLPEPPKSKGTAASGPTDLGQAAGPTNSTPGPLASGPGHDPNGAPGGGTGQATATFFQVPAQGKTIVYLIDSSSSMGPSGALDAACRQLRESIRRLPATARFQVITYNSSARPLLSDRWLDPTQDLNRVEQAVAALQAVGGTNHNSLFWALSFQPDALYFLTDDDDLPGNLVHEVTRRNHGRSVIHVIELNTHNRGRPDMPLQVLARDNGGAYRAVNLEEYR